MTRVSIVACDCIGARSPMQFNLCRIVRTTERCAHVRIGNLRKAPQTMTRNRQVVLEMQTNALRPCIGRSWNIGNVLCNLNDKRVQIRTGQERIVEKNFVGTLGTTQGSCGSPVGHLQRNVCRNFGQLSVDSCINARKLKADGNQGLGTLLRCLLRIASRKPSCRTVRVSVQGQPIVGGQTGCFLIVRKGVGRTSLGQLFAIHLPLGRTLDNIDRIHACCVATRRTYPKRRTISGRCDNETQRVVRIIAHKFTAKTGISLRIALFLGIACLPQQVLEVTGR